MGRDEYRLNETHWLNHDLDCLRQAPGYEYPRVRDLGEARKHRLVSISGCHDMVPLCVIGARDLQATFYDVPVDAQAFQMWPAVDRFECPGPAAPRDAFHLCVGNRQRKGNVRYAAGIEFEADNRFTENSMPGGYTIQIRGAAVMFPAVRI